MPSSRHPAFQAQIEQLTTTFAADLVRIMKAAIVENVTNAVADAPSAPVSVKAPAPVQPAKAGRRVPAARRRKLAPKAVAGPKRIPAAVAQIAGDLGQHADRKLPKKAKSKPKGAKRSAALIAKTTADLLAEITAHPGLRIEQIAKAMKTSTRELTLPAKKLLGQGKVKSTGVKRATTYSPA
jgi:hypothetical protein